MLGDLATSGLSKPQLMLQSKTLSDLKRILFNKQLLKPLSSLMQLLQHQFNQSSGDSFIGRLRSEILKLTTLVVSVSYHASAQLSPPNMSMKKAYKKMSKMPKMAKKIYKIYELNPFRK